MKIKNLLDDNHLIESFNVGDGICLGTINDIENNIEEPKKEVPLDILYMKVYLHQKIFLY